MGSYTQPLIEQMTPEKKRGILSALANVTEDPEQEHGAPVDFSGPVFSNPGNVKISDDTESAAPPLRLPNGVSAITGGYTGTPKLDVSNPVPAQVLPQGGMQEASANRIDDDPQTRSQGNTFETEAEGGANAARASLIQQMRAANQTDQQQPDHLGQLEAEYQKASQPVQFQKPSLLNRIGGFMAGFGHPEFAENQIRNRQFEENQQREKAGSLLQEIEQDRRTQEQQHAADARWNASENIANSRMSLQQQMEAQKEKAAQESQGRLFAQQNQMEDQRQAASQDAQSRLFAQQQQLERQRETTRQKNSEQGSWTLQEDEKGQPILFNAKSGETKPAPANLRAKGTFQKTMGPSEDALNYANQYMDPNAPKTGPGDEALMEKFFEMAKPSSGFRMTEPQMAMLRNAQGWKDSLVAKARHAYSGTWFSDDQRKQIVDTMNQLGKAKGSSAASGGSQPSGATHIVPGPDGKRHYTNAAGTIDLGIAQ